MSTEFPLRSYFLLDGRRVMGRGNGQPKKCIVKCDHPGTLRELKYLMGPYNSIKGEGENGELFVQIPNKHQSLLGTMRKKPHTKVKVVSEFPQPVEEPLPVEQNIVEKEPLMVRRFSKRQKERLRKEDEIRMRLAREQICGFHIPELKEFARSTPKRIFLHAFDITIAEFDRQALALVNKLEEEFGIEVSLGIYFIYECRWCGVVYSGQDAFRDFRIHTLRARHWEKK